jgi:hypothetical protein
LTTGTAKVLFIKAEIGAGQNPPISETKKGSVIAEPFCVIAFASRDLVQFANAIGGRRQVASGRPLPPSEGPALPSPCL